LTDRRDPNSQDEVAKDRRGREDRRRAPSAAIVRQCLSAGLLDGISVNLVRVLLGKGIGSFDNLSRTPVELEGPRGHRGDV
jgi:hypothetical protein